MKSPAAPLLVPAALLLLLSCSAGCAEEEAEGRQAAYPVVGTTPPPSEPPPPPAYAPASAAASEAPAPQPVSADVVIGGDEEGSQNVPPAESTAVAQAAQSGDADPAALTDFRSTLDPYGTWVDDASYGTVWVPSTTAVGADFAPYVSAGHWAYDDDYVWVSDYSWGWAPFHYGRWVFAPGIGWEWVPGRVYAGAWVSWRYGWDDWAYVGWAPLAPTWCWRHGYAVGIGFAPAAPYAFVGSGYLFAPGVHEHIVTGAHAGFIEAHTRPWAGGTSPALAGGRVIANPSVGGPPPSTLHIPQAAVPRVGSNAGVMQARGFARGSYAVAAPRAVAPAYGPPAPSHFGGRLLGGGFTGSPAASAPAYAREGAARPYFAPSPQVSASRPSPPSYHVGGGGAGAAYQAPAARGFAPGGAGAGSTGTFRSGGQYSSGFHSGGSFHGGSSGGGHVSRGGGGGHGGGHR